MQDKNVVRRRRAVFLLLALLSVVLITVAFGGLSGPLGAIQRGAQAVLSPIESGASIALKPIRDGINWVGDTFDAQDQNDELRSEVEALRTELARVQTDAREASELRAMVDLAETEGFPEGVEPVAARVIAQSPTDWYSTIQIDKGTDDGIEVDQPVIAGGGLVGKVTDATGGTATVTLITDADSAVSAQLVPGGGRGVVKPQVGNPEDLLFDFLDKDEKVKEGATVVTSGSTSSRFESLFPRGIPIGEVTRVDPDERELYQRVHIRPHAELQKMGFVQVLTGDTSVEAAEVAP